MCWIKNKLKLIFKEIIFEFLSSPILSSLFYIAYFSYSELDKLTYCYNFTTSDIQNCTYAKCDSLLIIKDKNLSIGILKSNF